MRNIRLILTYDGTRYFGWQKTNMGPSIEGELQLVLNKITQAPIVLQAASRTDAGVHAEGQVANFLLENDEIDLNRLIFSVNRLLPNDIAVLEAAAMPQSYHPTLDAVSKEYHYTLSLGSIQLPKHRYYAWHYPYKLNLQEMIKASKYLIGEHDFLSFCNEKQFEKETNFVRKINFIEFENQGDNQLKIIMNGNRFLYRMARIIAGTLVLAGRGKLIPSDIPKILKQKKRKNAGITAPAMGLSLFCVNY